MDLPIICECGKELDGWLDSGIGLRVGLCKPCVAREVRAALDKVLSDEDAADILAKKIDAIRPPHLTGE